MKSAKFGSGSIYLPKKVFSTALEFVCFQWALEWAHKLYLDFRGNVNDTFRIKWLVKQLPAASQQILGNRFLAFVKTREMTFSRSVINQNYFFIEISKFTVLTRRSVKYSRINIILVDSRR